MKQSKLLLALCALALLALTACKRPDTPTSNQPNQSGVRSTPLPGGATGSREENPNNGSAITELEPFGGCNAGDAEDREWCARLKIGQLGTQPPHMAVGDVPADPNVSNIYDHPVIFVSTELYIWLSSQTTTIRGYNGEFRNKQLVYFLPTGRYFYMSVDYLGQTTPKGQVSIDWGRYRFTSNDEIETESDAGEKSVMQLKFGRRNLFWEDTTFGQVDWENEALRRQTQQ